MKPIYRSSLFTYIKNCGKLIISKIYAEGDASFLGKPPPNAEEPLSALVEYAQEQIVLLLEGSEPLTEVVEKVDCFLQIWLSVFDRTCFLGRNHSGLQQHLAYLQELFDQTVSLVLCRVESSQEGRTEVERLGPATSVKPRHHQRLSLNPRDA